MQRLSYLFLTLLLFISLMAACEPRAFAYVDPGSGLLIYQTVGALATGATFWFRRRLKGLFSRTPISKPEQNS